MHVDAAIDYCDCHIRPADRAGPGACRANLRKGPLIGEERVVRRGGAGQRECGREQRSQQNSEQDVAFHSETVVCCAWSVVCCLLRQQRTTDYWLLGSFALCKYQLPSNLVSSKIVSTGRSPDLVSLPRLSV